MNTSKIIKGVVGGGRYTVTAPIIKEDYGLYLQIEGIELPETYEVDFSNDEHSGSSVTMIGNADGVLIPSQFIKSGKDVFAFIYHVGADYGRTVFKFRIPNKLRPDRTEEQPTPEEQSVIDQAISALNGAVAQTAQDVISADQSVQSAKEDADRAEQARDDAQTAQGKAKDAQESAERAKDDAETSERNASESERKAKGYADTASEKADAITGLTATAQTLPAGSSATASYNPETGVMSFGIPKGDTGESPVILRLSKDVVYVPMDREYRTKIAISDNIYYEYRRGDEQIDGIMDYTGTLTNTNITCINVRACTPTQKGYMRFTIPQGVPLRTNEDTQLVVHFRFVFDYTDLDGNRKTIARGINFVGVMDGEQGEPGAKGNPGDDGYSPTVSITPITGGHRITITDNDGTETADVMDGEDYILTEQDKEEIADMVEVPSDWLKAFPTDTASGAIASFTDGADNLPLKSLVVDIDPVQDTSSGDPSPENICPISGWTQVNVEQSGKNLVSKTISGYQINASGVISVNPNYDVQVGAVKTGESYTITNGDSNIVIAFYASEPSIGSAAYDGIRIVQTSHTFTAPINGFVAFRTNSGYSTPQIELGSTATDYEPYTGRSIAIDLGQTVYGGKLDVLSGVLTVTHISDTQKLSAYVIVSTGANTVHYRLFDSAFNASLPKTTDSCNFSNVAKNVYNNSDTTHFYPNISNGRIELWLPIGTNTNTDVQIVCELATPFEIQLTPNQVNSLLGVNNIWADSGDTMAEYRADTKLYIEKLTQPEEDDMIADSAITSGQFFMIGNSLYRALANIASGATITVGTNAQRVSLSDALNLVNA